MRNEKKSNNRTRVRALRVRARLKTGKDRLRVSVFRSLNNMYAQIIDDIAHHTIASFSTQQLHEKGLSKKEAARKVGIELGKLALAKDVKSVCFDRGPYLYHGRVKELAEGLRESGLVF